jgi:hypothetical protein
MDPGRRNGVDFQRLERQDTKHLIQVGGKERVEDLPQAVIIERLLLSARLKQGQHPTLRQPGPHFVEGMMAVENRQHQRFYPSPTGEDIIGVRGKQLVNKGGDLELA